MPRTRIRQRQYDRAITGLAPKATKEEETCKMYFKSGNSTMLLCKNITKLAANSLDMYITRYCKQHGSKLEGQFIFTK